MPKVEVFERKLKEFKLECVEIVPFRGQGQECIMPDDNLCQHFLARNLKAITGAAPPVKASATGRG